MTLLSPPSGPTRTQLLVRTGRAIVLACLLTAGWPAVQPSFAAPPGGSAAWSVDRLMATLAQQKSGRARFVETKYLAMLQAPLESRGELQFVAPDRLVKRTLAPRPETLTVAGDMLTIERGGRNTTIPLSNFPELAAFIESLRGTLAGNRQALEQYYRLNLAGRAEQWTLTLEPRDARMASAISNVRIDGEREQLRRVEIRHADGDRSVMTIQPQPGP